MRKNISNLISADYLYKAVLKSSSAKVLTFGLGYVFQIMLARILSLDDYGYYSYIINLGLLTSTFAIFGLNSSSKRFVSGYRSLSKGGYIWGFILFAIIIIALLSVLIGVADYYFLEYQEKNPTNLSLIFLVFLILAISYNDFLSNFLFAIKQPFMAAFSMNGIRYVFSIVILGAMFLMSYSLDSNLVIKVVFVAILITIASQVYTIITRVKFEKPKFESKPWISTSAGLLMAGAFVAVQNKIDIQILGIMRSDAEVGLYSAVYRTTQITQFFFKAVAGVSMPIIAEMFAKKESLFKIQNRLNKMIKLTFWPSILIIVLMAAGSYYLLLIFGEEYVQGQNVLIVLLVGQLSISMMGSANMVLNMSGNHKYTTAIYAGASVMNILLNIYLIPDYGVLGAAISTMIVNIFSSITANTIVRRKLGLNTSIFKLSINANKS